MPFAEVNGVKIHYVQIPCEAEGHSEDLVMVHGLASSLAFWYFTHASVFSKRYRVTLYDLRGHGRSGVAKDGYTAGNMAIDLEQLLDHLSIERAHFIAHSFGGAVALNMACRKRERFTSLILADTHISAVRKQNKRWKFGENIKRILDAHAVDIDMRDPYFGIKMLTVASRLRIQDSKITGELKDLISPLMGMNSTRSAAQWLKLMETTHAEKELTSDDGLSLDGLRKLNLPILAVYGERSQAMATGEQLFDLWPHAGFHRIRDAGHFFPETRAFEFIDTCRMFLDKGAGCRAPRREGDFNERYFRSSRFYHREDKWFFDTREAIKKGPFGNIEEARENAARCTREVL